MTRMSGGEISGMVEVIVADAPGWCLQHVVRLADGVERLADCSLPLSSPSNLPEVSGSQAEGGQHTVCRTVQ